MLNSNPHTPTDDEPRRVLHVTPNRRACRIIKASPE